MVQKLLEVSTVGRCAGEDLTEERAEGKDIGTLVQLFDAPLGLFGRHVLEGAHDGSAQGLGARAVVSAANGSNQSIGLKGGLARGGLATEFLVDHLGEPPVHDLHLAKSTDHYVVRLEVAMDDAAGVGVCKGQADILEAIDHGE